MNYCLHIFDTSVKIGHSYTKDEYKVRVETSLEPACSGSCYVEV